MIKVFLANLGAYNQGKTRGKWLKLPATEDEIIEVSACVGSDGEIFISDVESEFVRYVDELADLTELNELAERLEDVVNQYGKNIVKAVINEFYALNDALDVLESGSFIFIDGVQSVYDLGLVYVQDGFLGDIPKEVAEYLDYEALGADLTGNGWSIYSDLGIAVCIP